MFFPVDRESLTEATSGAIGALVSTIVLYPLDTCKTKLQAELQTHQGMHKYRYGGPTPSLGLSSFHGILIFLKLQECCNAMLAIIFNFTKLQVHQYTLD